MENFAHTSIFESNVSYGGSFFECPFYSKASLEGLRPLIPSYEIDLDRNIDLLAFAANACAAGYANKNEDMLEPEAAIGTVQLWRNKMVNANHNRDKVVGHLVTSSFSSYNDNVLISAEDALASKEPFNISVGGVVYKIADSELASSLESSANPDSPLYKSISLSLEIGFPVFGLAIGSKNFYEAEIIRDEKYVGELKKYLSAYGGEGKTNNGEKIYRLIGKEHLPLAVALTKKPAGIMPLGAITHNSNREPEKKTTISLSSENNFDKSQKPSVTPNKHPQNMEKFEQILEEIKAHMIKDNTTKGFEAAMADKIREASESYVAKVNEAKASQEKAEKESAEFKASQEALVKDLAETKDKLAKIEAEASAKSAADLFSARMAEFDEEFDLDADDKQILASDLKTLDSSEAAFTSYKDKMAKLMKDKNKKGKEAKEKEAKASIDKLVAEKLTEISKASTKKLSDKELAEKALEEAKASEKQIPNNNGGQNPEDLKEAWAKAFSADNIKISFN
jgi:hypothetical protein